MRFFILIVLPMWLFALPLSTLIENAKNTHMSIDVIEQRVKAVEYEREISRNFADPVLSLSVSDIQFQDPTNRSLEPMQYQALNFTQKIPYFGKRDALSKKVDAKKHKISLSIDEAKVKLVKNIKIVAYSIWQQEQELKITNEYIELTKQNIELYSAYSSSDVKSHMSIMSADMTLSQLNIKKSRFTSSIVALYEKLYYLSGMNAESIELDMSVPKPKDISYFTDAQGKNSSLKVKEARYKEALEDLHVKELASNIDPIVKVGYFNRESFKDYLNVGVSFSIPIYGTDESKAQKSKKLALSYKSQVSDFSNLIESKIVQTHVKLWDLYRVYGIIQNQSLPQIEHMFDLSSSSIKSGQELFVYISLLEKKLSLDEQNIGIVATYHKTKAELDALIGEMK